MSRQFPNEEDRKIKGLENSIELLEGIINKLKQEKELLLNNFVDNQDQKIETQDNLYLIKRLENAKLWFNDAQLSVLLDKVIVKLSKGE